MEKVSNAAGAKLRDLKRRKDFDEMILPARKVARTGAEREAKRKSGRTPEQVDKERADASPMRITKNEQLLFVCVLQMHLGPTILGPPPVGRHRT